MAVLSNNGRLINSLPVATVLVDNDQLIIQSPSAVNPSGVTKRISYGLIENTLYNNVINSIQYVDLKHTGSFYSPNTTGFANFYTTKIRNGLTVTAGGITVNSGDCNFQGLSAGAGIFSSINSTEITGNLAGNVTGNVTGNITSAGTSTFNNVTVSTLTVNTTLTSNGTNSLYTIFTSNGAINGTTIGQSNPTLITGTKITGSVAIKSGGNLFVDGDAKLLGLTYTNNLTASHITASKGITGSLKGKLTGDIFSTTGYKVLENGSGLPKYAYFYGTSSYALTSSRALTASYAINSITITNVKFALSASYASSSRFSFSSSYASSSKYSIFSFSSSYASSSRFSFSSSYASSSITSSFSKNSRFSFSSSYATSSKKSLSSLYASSSKSSLTSSLLLQTNNSYTNNLAYYDSVKLTKLNDFKVDESGFYRFLYFSGSSDPLNPAGSITSNKFIIIDGYQPSNASNIGQAGLALSLDINRSTRNVSSLAFPYNYGPEAWNFLVYNSGSLAIQSYKQSYAFSSSNYYIKYNTPLTTVSTFNPVQFINNSIYFWGEPFSYNTAMRDGALGIGVPAHSVTTGNSNLKARLQIDVFSSSYNSRGTGTWIGSAPVRELPALLVRYGSGSIGSPMQKTFYVSGSGDTYMGGEAYIGGDTYLNGNLTSSQDAYIGGDLFVQGNIFGIGSSAYAKAWCNFNFVAPNTTVLTSSFNVTSVTRNGLPGDYTISFSTAFSNTNYLMMGLAQKRTAVSGVQGIVTYATNPATNTILLKGKTQVRIFLLDPETNAGFDPLEANIIFFGT